MMVKAMMVVMMKMMKMMMMMMMMMMMTRQRGIYENYDDKNNNGTSDMCVFTSAQRLLLRARSSVFVKHFLCVRITHNGQHLPIVRNMLHYYQ